MSETLFRKYQARYYRWKTHGTTAQHKFAKTLEQRPLTRGRSRFMGRSDHGSQPLDLRHVRTVRTSHTIHTIKFQSDAQKTRFRSDGPNVQLNINRWIKIQQFAQNTSEKMMCGTTVMYTRYYRIAVLPHRGTTSVR